MKNEIKASEFELDQKHIDLENHRWSNVPVREIKTKQINKIIEHLYLMLRSTRSRKGYYIQWLRIFKREIVNRQ